MESPAAKLKNSPKSLTCLSALLMATFMLACPYPKAQALGLIAPHAAAPHNHLFVSNGKKGSSKNFTDIRSLRHAYGSRTSTRRSDDAGNKRGSRLARKTGARGKKNKIAKSVLYCPQNYADSLKSTVIEKGVVYKKFKGPLVINVLDIDMLKADVKIRPILAGGAFDSLQNVAQQARANHAIAAVNANYFKKNGTPLGTLIVDGEWVSGPIYDRVALGLTKSGSARVDRVKLAGDLETSNQAAPRIWINNINQPRRTGSRLVAYTRRWGNYVRLPYEGCLVAVNAAGDVVDKSLQYMTIPLGGYVLTDSKGGPISKLAVGDHTTLTWKILPADWSDVVEAVSGGPLLIRDGKLFVDLKDESFRAGWTGCQIKARTAAGVTQDHHLLLVTVEGSHTLWDLAKFLRHLGAVDALNLDGGGSTAMYVNGETVTQSKRKVASAIGIFPKNASDGQQRAYSNSSQNQVIMPAPAENKAPVSNSDHLVSSHVVSALNKTALPMHLGEMSESALTPEPLEKKAAASSTKLSTQSKLEIVNTMFETAPVPGAKD
jgi:uncharacterized protein YigE (DUF2233 family)